MTMTETPADAVPPAAESDTRRAWRRPPVFPILVIWAGLTVVLGLFAYFVPAHLMGEPASDRMLEVQSTFTAFSLASAPVAGLVWAVTLYSLIGWRHRGTEMPVESGHPMRGHGRTQLIWVLLSSVLCLFLLVWGLVLLDPPETPADAATPPLVVDVTGQQWAWTFAYPAGELPASPPAAAAGDEPVQTDTLYLPVGRRVVFHVTSKDVAHSFWVGPMAVKVDANPGQTTVADVTPNKIGTFPIRCAELCGLYHAQMQTTVHVVSPAEFDSWLTTLRASAPSPVGPSPEATP
jgi:cytochrome c oxidase subunit II